MKGMLCDLECTLQVTLLYRRGGQEGRSYRSQNKVEEMAFAQRSIGSSNLCWKKTSLLKTDSRVAQQSITPRLCHFKLEEAVEYQWRKEEIQMFKNDNRADKDTESVGGQLVYSYFIEF